MQRHRTLSLCIVMSIGFADQQQKCEGKGKSSKTAFPLKTVLNKRCFLGGRGVIASTAPFRRLPAHAKKAKPAFHFQRVVGNWVITLMLLVFATLLLTVKHSLRIIKHCLALDAEGRLPPAESVTLVLCLLCFP